MKKFFLCLVFVRMSFLALPEELTSFMNIEFGTPKKDCITLMEKQNWIGDLQNDINMTFYNESGSYLGIETKSAILSFSKNQNNEFVLTGGTIILSVHDIELELYSYIEKLQDKYEIKSHETFEGNELPGFVLYTPNDNRIVITLGYRYCSITFGVNEKGLISKKDNTSVISSPVGSWTTDYVIFSEILDIFSDGSFVWIISGGKVDGMANGVYSIDDQGGKKFIIFKTTTQRGNISLLLDKIEKFEILKITDSELEIKTTKSDDLFKNIPMSFEKK